MHYMLLYYLRERPEPGTPAGDALFGGMAAYTRGLAERGALVHSGPLAGPSAAATVRGAAALVTTGPFAETAEWLGGYAVVDAPDLEAALALAADCPSREYGSVEVRPMLDPTG